MIDPPCRYKMGNSYIVNIRQVIRQFNEQDLAKQCLVQFGLLYWVRILKVEFMPYAFGQHGLQVV